MKLTIVYDNEIFTKNIGLISDWGFSCLIETEDEFILFDTGAKGNILLNNMEKLNINPKNITKIIISHEHWDHNGGLQAILPLVHNIQLYRTEIKNSIKKIKSICVDKEYEISKDCFSTGRLSNKIDEQSLIIKVKNGCYILAGCSHPGLENIFGAANKYGPIKGLIGGLHGFNNFSIVKDLEFICPCHCTSHKKELKKIFPNSFSECGVGKIIYLDV